MQLGSSNFQSQVTSSHEDKCIQTRHHSSPVFFNLRTNPVQTPARDYASRLLSFKLEKRATVLSVPKRRWLSGAVETTAPPSFTPAPQQLHWDVHCSPFYKARLLFCDTTSRPQYTQDRVHFLFPFLMTTTAIVGVLLRAQVGCCEQHQLTTEDTLDEN